MNIKQIKLALTVDLLNKPTIQDPIRFALEKMDGYSTIIGDFQGTKESYAARINDNMEWKSLALNYEHCTLNMDFIHDNQKNEDYLQTFDIQAISN